MIRKIALAVVAAGALTVLAAPAQAHVSLSFGIVAPAVEYPAPVYYPPVQVYQAPVYGPPVYGPPAVVYRPAPVYGPYYAPQYPPRVVYRPYPYQEHRWHDHGYWRDRDERGDRNEWRGQGDGRR